MKENKGITLIALVVTIIILIILAGVSISIVLGENGVIKKSKETKERYTIEAIREKLDIVKGSNYIEKIGNTNIEDYFETLEKEKIEPYTITNKQKMTDELGSVEVDNQYSYLITIEENNNIKIEYEGNVGQIERKPDNVTISITGEKNQVSMPIKLSANIKTNGKNVTSGKYIINNTAEKIGIEDNSYTEQISDSNINVILEQANNYYIHTLTIDRYGRKQETVKGPISVAIQYHKHIGNSSANGGCYTSPIYHSHTSSCYTRKKCGTWNLVGFTGKTASGLTIVSYKCSGCGTGSSDVKDTSGNGWGRYGDDQYHWTQALTCTLGNSVVGYNLACNKTETTIEGYIANY